MQISNSTLLVWFSLVWFTYFLNYFNWAEAVALLEEQLLPTPEDSGSNPDISNFNMQQLFTVMCSKKTKIKKRAAGNCPFFTSKIF